MIVAGGNGANGAMPHGSQSDGESNNSTVSCHRLSNDFYYPISVCLVVHFLLFYCRYLLVALTLMLLKKTLDNLLHSLGRLFQ